jgi:hypothetical protein
MITREQAVEAFLAVEKFDKKIDAARALSIDTKTLNRRLSRYYADPEAIVYKNALENRIPYDEISMAWIKNKEVSIMWKKDNNVMSYEEIRDNLVEEMKRYSPVYPSINRDYSMLEDDRHLLVIDAADVHVGKLARTYETGQPEYNTDIATKRVQEGVKSLLLKSVSFNIDKIIFVIGNDILHTDNPRRTTTSGTPQDTVGQWWEMFLAAKMAYIKAIELMAQYADVHIIFCPSNHDYTSGWMLADTISSWFRNHENVHFGMNNMSVSINHRKYAVYGNNLLGFTHGDGAKEKDLAALMQYEAREMWGKTKYAYIFTHHTHHKHRKTGNDMLEKDHIGVTTLSTSRVQRPENSVYIETVRSPSPADGWHSRNGYVNQQAIEAFIHNHENGQVARLTEYF